MAGALEPDQVLVIYNSQHADSTAVWEHYRASRPGVHGCDLNDPDLQPGTVSYADFIARVRDPVRGHLSVSGLAEQVVVLVLTKGLPHRILDLGAGDVGDHPGPAGDRIAGGDASYASVDSELTLLWQDLEAGESGGGMDCAADNRVENPYFNGAQPVSNYDRSGIRSARYFHDPGTGRWQMRTRRNGAACTPGDLYLVSRLDGSSLPAVKGMIDRGKSPWYDSGEDQLILDKSAGGTIDGGDYNLTRLLVAGSWPRFVLEESNLFLIGQNGDLPGGNTSTSRVTGRVAALTGYGGNHDGYNRSGFISTYAGQLSAGAVYSGYESYNGRKFGGVGGFGDHGQLSDWVEAGGTFGIGNAWEPLASGASKNYVLLKRYFVDGMSWVESAWASVSYLSWQTVVIGDPLAVASFGDPPPSDPIASMRVEGNLDEEAGGVATVVVELSAPARANTAVRVAFSGADEGADFSVAGVVDGEVMVAADATSASFEVVALRDQEAEGVEVLGIQVEPGSGYQASGEGVTVPIADTSFGDWVASTMGPGGDDLHARAEQDSDGDGLPSIVEFVMGLDPWVGNEPLQPAVTVESTVAGKEVVYRFPVLPSATGVIWQVERSEDLSEWEIAEALDVGSEGVRDLMEVRTPADAGRAAYFRFRATLAP